MLETSWKILLWCCLKCTSFCRSPKAWKLKFWVWKAMMLLLAPIQVGFCSRCTSSSGYHKAWLLKCWLWKLECNAAKAAICNHLMYLFLLGVAVYFGHLLY